MKVFVIVVAMLCIVAFLRRRAGRTSASAPAMDLSAHGPRQSGLGSLIDSLRVPGPSVAVVGFQRAVIAAILSSGVITLRTRSLVFGNTLVVRISDEAESTIRPVRKLVIAEILDDVFERAAKEGFRMSERPVLELVVDKSLDGLDVRVDMAFDEDTPMSVVDHSTPAGQGVRPSVQPVLLYRLRSGAEPFEVPADGSRAIIGRSASSTWQIDSPLVSGHHLDVNVERDVDGNSALAVVDRKSTNGTAIDDRPVEKGRRYTVEHGSVLALGPDVELRVLIGTSTDADTDPSTGSN